RLSTILLLAALGAGCGPKPESAGGEADRAAGAKAHLDAGAGMLKAGDPRAALKEFAVAVELAPDSADAHFLLGLAAFETDDHRTARTEFEAALERDAKHAGALEHLGRVEYAENRLPQAIARWEATLAVEPDRPGVKALLEKARKELEVESKFREEFTQHFRLKFEGGAPAEEGVARRVGEVLESAYSDVGYALGHYPERVIPVILYADKEFYAVTGSHGWVGGLFDGKIRIPVKDIFKADPSALDRVIRHEYTHACVYTLAPRCPTWLQEGLAQHFEGARPDLGRVNAAARAGSLPAFAALATEFTAMKDPEKVRLVYAQSAAFVDWLVARRGAPDVASLLRELGTGESIEAAAERVYGTNLSGLEAEWRGTLAQGPG
ncbi:MAG TPA: tetratricopeptide repeat protein, partial [Planctomycetota bacterium]|nr:tetratricopeptide repeat protein [Planctomycetota bacterium]